MWNFHHYLHHYHYHIHKRPSGILLMSGWRFSGISFLPITGSSIAVAAIAGAIALTRIWYDAY